MVGPFAELRQKLLVSGNDRGVAPVVGWVDRARRRTREVDWVSGACLLVRRGDLDAAGGLDERFFMHLKDVDLCAAVRARRRAVLFAGDTTVIHLRGRSGVSARAAVRAAYRRSQIAFYEKHRPAWVPALRAYLAVRGQLPRSG